MKKTQTIQYSGLMVGKVWHKRYSPRVHEFCYRVFYGLFDLDELSALDKQSWLFAVDRMAPLSLRRADYGVDPHQSGPDLKTRVVDLIEQQFGAAITRVELLTMPRVFGYAFNPISVYYCYAQAGLLTHVIYEVNNTFGERFSYAFSVEDDGGILPQHACLKQLHVSPFFDVSGGYQFRQKKSAHGIKLAIDYRSEAPEIEPAKAGGCEPAKARRKSFSAAMLLEKINFSPLNLLATSVRIPFVTLKVIAAIHWQALLLWVKKTPDFS